MLCLRVAVVHMVIACTTVFVAMVCPCASVWCALSFLLAMEFPRHSYSAFLLQMQGCSIHEAAGAAHVTVACRGC